MQQYYHTTASRFSSSDVIKRNKIRRTNQNLLDELGVHGPEYDPPPFDGLSVDRRFPELLRGAGYRFYLRSVYEHRVNGCLLRHLHHADHFHLQLCLAARPASLNRVYVRQDHSMDK